MTEQPEKRKIMKRSEWFMLAICGLIFLYFILAANGIHIVERAETITEVRRPGSNYEGSSEVYRDAELDARVDKKLKEMAREFSAESKGRARVRKKDLRQKGLNEDEAEYFEEVKERHKFSDKIESAKDWYNILKASQNTYSKVKNVFQKTDSGDDSTITQQDITSMLGNETLRNIVFDKIQDQFAIPKEKTADFAKEGKRELNEWADFVESNKGGKN